MSAPSYNAWANNAGNYGPAELRLIHLGQRGKPTKDEVFDIIGEKNLDVFRQMPIFNVYYSNVDFGDKDEDEIAKHAKAQKNMDDQIFATDNENEKGKDRKDRSYFDDTPPSPYVDVSEFYEEPTFPKMYKEPADPVMPSVLDKYLINKADIGEKIDVADVEGALEHYGEYQKQMKLPDPVWGEAERAPEKYVQNEKVKHWAKNTLKVIGLDPKDKFSYQELDYWRQVAGTKNISSRKDSDRIKRAYRDHNGELPQKYKDMLGKYRED